jgi:hypothetical protein
MFDVKLRHRGLGVVLCLLAPRSESFALGNPHYVATIASEGSFAIAQKQTVTSIYVDSNDYPGMVRAAKDLQSDVERVTNCKPLLT